MAKFCVGDTVCLKSGGPAMTVKVGEGPNVTTVECIYFHGGKLVSESFRAATIEHVECQYALGFPQWVPSSKKKSAAPVDAVGSDTSFAAHMGH